MVQVGSNVNEKIPPETSSTQHSTLELQVVEGLKTAAGYVQMLQRASAVCQQLGFSMLQFTMLA